MGYTGFSLVLDRAWQHRHGPHIPEDLNPMSLWELPDPTASPWRRSEVEACMSSQVRRTPVDHESWISHITSFN